eukprot:2219119-Rhodomonas_salina.1
MSSREKKVAAATLARAAAKKAIKELKAQLAAAQRGTGPKQPLTPKPTNTPRQDGTGSKKQHPDRVEKHCAACGQTHWGKCFKDCVKEQRERLALDEAKLKEMQLRDKENRAMSYARAVGDVDSNESDSDYIR